MEGAIGNTISQSKQISIKSKQYYLLLTLLFSSALESIKAHPKDELKYKYIYNIDSSFKVLNKGLIILDQKGELGNKFRLLFQEQTFF